MMMVTTTGDDVVAVFDYFPYGKKMEEMPGGGKEETHTFTGKELDRYDEDIDPDEDGEGLYYFGARYYDPDIGSFTSTDPAMQFWNVYAYGPGNPISGTDPSGRIWDYENMIVEELQMHIDFLEGAQGDELSYYLQMEADPNITYYHKVRPDMPGNMGLVFGTGIIAYKDVSRLADYTLVQEVTHVYDLYYRDPIMLPTKGGKYNIDLEEHGWDLQVEYMERNKIPIEGSKWDYWYWKSKGNRERKIGVLERIPDYSK